jgi:ligand-binding sensor domain-containing protein/serine phosphatase RsbU (regulator of sigma subunit)
LQPIKRIFLLFLFATSLLDGVAQQYNFRQYNVQDGLAHSQVSTILQDFRGYMWFATYGGGLSKFDGKNFITYTEKDGLTSNIIRPMIQDNKGDLWLGTMGGGVCKFDGKKFSKLKDSTTKINDKIYTIVQSRNGTIWFGADNGLYSYDGHRVKHFDKKDGFPEVPVMSVFEDSKGIIWITPWENGVYCYDPGLDNANKKEKKFRQFTEKDGLSYHTMMCVNEDEEGNIWISGFKGMTKLTRKKDGTFNFSRSFSPLIDQGLIYMVLDDKMGNLWFATTDKGLIKYNKSENTYTKINSKNGLAGDVILSIIKDREGNLWTSTWGFGVSMFQGERFVNYTEKEGLGTDLIAHLIEDGKGGLIINSSNGIYKYSPANGIQLFDKNFPKLRATAIAIDNKGNLWLGGSDALYSYNNGKLKKYTKADGITSFPITTILCDNDNIWTASWSGGLTSFNGKTFKNYSAKDGLSSTYIYTLFKNNNGEICIGTWDGGLNIFDGKTFKVYKKEQGLPSNNVISIVQEKGNIWIGTFGGGVCEMDASVKDHKILRTITSKDGLSDDAIVALALDKNENVFIAGSKGLNRLDAKKNEIRFYGKNEGFTGIECTHNSALTDPEGNLWFGTKKGLTKYNPKNDLLNTVTPVTYITDIKLFFEKTDWSKFTDSINPVTLLPEHLNLKYTDNHLTFNFIGINTSIPEKVRYSYMLEGADKNWSPPTDKSDVTYSGLSPGDYSFKVIACNNDGIWEKRNITTFSFVIEPPFWKQTWFYILCIFIIFGCTAFYTKWQTKKLARENKILEVKVIERTAEIEKQKDELHIAYKEIENKNILVEQKNRDITDSINYAQRIQHAILPLEETILKSLKNSFVLFKPRDIVSGDFYWFAQIESKSILAVVDCTGHGVPGAFMSMIGNSLLNEIVYEKKIVEPAKILNYLDDGVRLSLKQDQQNNETHDGMDISLISIEGSKLQYAGAHRPLYIIRNGSLQEIAADKFPIGGMQTESKKIFNNRHFELEPNDMLYMFTDGYVDQFGGDKGKKFMSRRFQELLLTINNKPTGEQKEILDQTIENWKSHLEQIDDILVIGVKIS